MVNLICLVLHLGKKGVKKKRERERKREREEGRTEGNVLFNDTLNTFYYFNKQ